MFLLLLLLWYWHSIEGCRRTSVSPFGGPARHRKRRCEEYKVGGRDQWHKMLSSEYDSTIVFMNSHDDLQGLCTRLDQPIYTPPWTRRGDPEATALSEELLAVSDC
ncbi:hypothetical protein STEG23_018351 [Scotinomys teguina]